MPGTPAGGKKTRETNLKKYGKDYYSRIGKMGGSAEHTKPRGFAAMTKEQIRAITSKGGKVYKPSEKVKGDIRNE